MHIKRGIKINGGWLGFGIYFTSAPFYELLIVLLLWNKFI